MTATKMKPDFQIRVLRAISKGARSLSDLKKALKKDVRSVVNQLTDDKSVFASDEGLILTKRGAGRLRFAS